MAIPDSPLTPTASQERDHFEIIDDNISAGSPPAYVAHDLAGDLARELAPFPYYRADMHASHESHPQPPQGRSR